MPHNGVRVVLLALLLAACGGGGVEGPVGPRDSVPPPPPAPRLLASAPVPRTLLGQAGGETVAYVSAPNGLLTRGARAAVVNVRTGARADAVVEEGGFDPVALVAADGDVVEVTLTDSAGQVTTTPLAVKRGTKPRVVRTAPEPRATDVPLNSVIRVVFTTPVTRAAAEAAVRLLRGGEVVEGTVRMNGDADVVVDFEPAARLAANADYELQVDGALRDVLGTALEAPVAVPFTTGTTEAPATAVGLQVGRFGAIPRFTLALGDSVELVAYAYGSARIPIRQEISWTSSRETVLQVRAVPVPPSAPLGSRAIMRGVGGGAVVVQAAVGSVSGGFGLFVNDPGSVVPVSGRLVVTRSTASGIRLVAVDADGGNAAPLLAAGTQPTAAPDGRIAYVTSQGEISVLQGGAQVVRFERPQSGALMCPAFSPDGEWLAYVRRRYGPDFSDWFADEVELVVARSAPPEIEVIVFLSPRGDATPCGYWSPDGRRLAYTLDGDAWIVDLQLDGSSSPRVSPSRRLVAGWSAGPFSPDGSRMASLRSWRSAGAELGFVSVADGSVDLGDRFFWQQYGWRLYRSDDTEPRTLGPNGWSADGSWFVFDLSQQYGVGIARPGRAGVGLLLEGSFPAVMPSIATGSTREP